MNDHIRCLLLHLIKKGFSRRRGMNLLLRYIRNMVKCVNAETGPPFRINRLNRITNCDFRKYSRNKLELSQDLFQCIFVRTIIWTHFKDLVLDVKISVFNEKWRITLITAFPARLVGEDGENIKQLKKVFALFYDDTVDLYVEGVELPWLHSGYVARVIAKKLQGVFSVRDIKIISSEIMRSGAEGVVIIIKGRIGTSTKSEKKSYRIGRTSLNNLHNNVHATVYHVQTSSGTCGVRVIINLPQFYDARLGTKSLRRRRYVT